MSFGGGGERGRGQARAFIFACFSSFSFFPSSGCFSSLTALPFFLSSFPALLLLVTLRHFPPLPLSPSWYTAGVLSELREESLALLEPQYIASKKTIDILLSCLRLSQEFMAPTRTAEDKRVLDALEVQVSKARDRMNGFMGNDKFGSIFSARHQPSLFSASLKRYCDLYFSSVEALENYSPEQRFYPDSGLASTLPHQDRRSDEKAEIERRVLEGVKGRGGEDGGGEEAWEWRAGGGSGAEGEAGPEGGGEEGEVDGTFG